jgi:hypothetical protein
MNWMPWKGDGQKKLPGPKDIPQLVGSYLVTEAKMSPDLVWKLKAVMMPRSNEKGAFDVRVYESSMVQRKDVKVIDYNSLDDHPDLVIFDGWYNTNTFKAGKRDAAVS